VQWIRQSKQMPAAYSYVEKLFIKEAFKLFTTRQNWQLWMIQQISFY